MSLLWGRLVTFETAVRIQVQSNNNCFAAKLIAFLSIVVYNLPRTRYPHGFKQVRVDSLLIR